MKTRKNKGGAFFYDNKHKTCDNNKKDWRKTWEKFRDKENNRPYALYDSSYLYPGSMNLRGAVPTQGNLLDEQGQPRKCPESPIKSCEDNKYDWQHYWSSNPAYSGFIPTHLYPSDTNLTPIPNGLKTPDGKPCIKAEFTQYVNSRAYDQLNKEQRNQPEQLNQQIEDQWQKVDLTKHPKQYKQPFFTKEQEEQKIKDEEEVKEKRLIRKERNKLEKNKNKAKTDLKQITIIKKQLTNPINKKTFIKIILAFLKKQKQTSLRGENLFNVILIELNEDTAYTQQELLEEREAEEKRREEQEELQRRQEGKLSIPKPPKFYPANTFIEKLTNQLSLEYIERIINKTNYKKVLDYLLQPSEKPYIGTLDLHDIEYTLGTQEFNRLIQPLISSLLEPKINEYGQELQQYKKQQTRKRQNFVPGISEIDEEPEEQHYDEIVSIIVSHNTRIQCLLDGIQQNESEDKIRFMNCAILKLELSPEKVKLSMVYQGELSDKEFSKIDAGKPYYVQDISTKPGHIQYPTVMYDYHTIQSIMKLPDIISKFTFYIIRHGQAAHNVKNMLGVSKTLGLTLDTAITELGSQQAENAGRYLNDYLVDLKMPTRFFVSDLIRTHQTLDSILNMMGIIESIPSNIKGNFKRRPTPIVLPCSNELPIKGNLGQCDKATADAPSRQKMARENDTKCILRPDRTLSADCSQKVDWHTLYFPFYQYVSQRVQEDTASNIKSINSCQDSNMIAMSLLYLTTDNMETMTPDEKIDLINDYVEANKPDEEPQYSGGRRTRKNKK